MLDEPIDAGLPGTKLELRSLLLKVRAFKSGWTAGFSQLSPPAADLFGLAGQEQLIELKPLKPPLLKRHWLQQEIDIWTRITVDASFLGPVAASATAARVSSYFIGDAV